MSFWSAWGSAPAIPTFDHVVRLGQLREAVVHVLESNEGFGEVDRNNDGPLIRAIGGTPGNEWCALLAGYAWRRAHVLCGYPEPDWCYRRPGVLEVGAKNLGNAMAKAPGGVKFTDPSKCLPGDYAVWHRRLGPISGKGHIGTVLAKPGPDAIVETMEGNVGRLAKVRRFHHDVTKERFAFFAGLR